MEGLELGREKYGRLSNDDDVELMKTEYEKIQKDYDNGPVWEKAKKISRESYGEIRWPFVMWLYERLK